MSIYRRTIIFFSNLSIQYKFLAAFWGALIILFITSGMIIFYLRQNTFDRNIRSELKNTTKTILNMIKTSAQASIKNHLRAIAETNREITQSIYDKHTRGEYNEREARKRASEILLSQTIGKTGYMYCANSKGTCVLHPKTNLIGQNLLDFKFVQYQVKHKEGYLEYDWKNPGEKKKRPKALYMVYFEPWDWIISASSYREEFKDLVNVTDFYKGISSLKFGKTGYTYVIDSKGYLVIHPKLKGNLYNATDGDGRYFVHEICAQKNGQIIYSWKNPGEEEYREKLVIFNYIPELDWIVASSSYLEEFYEPIDMVRNIIIVTTLILLLLVFLITFKISSSITMPLNTLMKGFELGSQGDLSLRIHREERDEVGQLGRYFNIFMEHLATEVEERKKAEVGLRQAHDELEKRVKERTAELMIANYELQEETAERKQAEKELKQSEEKYRSIFENAVIGIFQITVEGKFISTNNTMAQILGYESPEELMGSVTNSKQLYSSSSDLKAIIELLNKDKKVISFETQFTRKDGSLVNVVINAHSVRDENQGVAYYEGVMEDNTEKKRAKELTIAKDAAEASNRAKSDFLANISHEIKTPINAILGYSKVLTNLVLDQEHKKNLEIIQTNGKNLLTLINDILDLSKIEANKLKIVYTPIDFDNFLKEIMYTFSIKIKEKGIELLMEIAPGFPPVIITDEIRLRQVLINLIGNAVKFTDQGYIKLTARKKQYGKENNRIDLVLTIEDTGIGIPENQLESIFEAFEQQRGQNVKYGGTGIGLTITKQLVDMLNGRMFVSSVVDRGTMFTLEFHEVETSSEKIESPDKTVQDHDLINFEESKILLVENTMCGEMLGEAYLESQNIRVFKARDGREALENIWEFTPDLVLMDINMPEMDGYRTAKILKSDDLLKDIPIILMVGDLIKEDEKEVRKIGCNGLLVKPVNEDELLSQLMKFLPYHYHQGKQELKYEKNQGMEPTDDLSSLTGEELSEINRFLLTDLTDEWKAISEVMILDKWEVFGNKVKELGEQYNATPLINYGQSIIDNINWLNIIQLKNIMKQFPKFVEMLTQKE
ncbi:MAG: response regulator [bacterium]|nr:response regulator [bacterium]